MRKIWIIPVALIIFAFACAFIDPLRTAVVGALQAAGGGTYTTVSGWWTNISGSPLYQTYHVLIWVGGTIILAYGIHQLHAKDKLPIWKTKQPQGAAAPMGAPQAVIIREVPVSTRAEPPATPEKETEKAQEAPAS